MRLILQQLRELLHSHFTYAGEDWDMKHIASVAKCLQRGAGTVGSRKYRIEIAADMEVERRAFEQIRLLFVFDAFWQLVPPNRRTVSLRCLSFRMVSRIGCMLEYYLRERHRNFPQRMFSALGEMRACANDLRRQAAALCKWLVDAFTAEMLSLHASWDSPEFKAKLRTIATLANIAMIGIECRHASMRRVRTFRCTQTHTTELRDLGAEFVMQQLSREQLKHKHLQRLTMTMASHVINPRKVPSVITSEAVTCHLLVLETK